MPYRFALQRSSLRLALCLAVCVAAPASIASAQSALDPRVIEFLPASGMVTGYQAEISVGATAQVLQLINLGLPSVEADGMIRTDFASKLSGTPVPGVAYVSKIVTTGPLGTATSGASNPFTFSPCTYRLATTTALLPAAGGPGAVDVTVTGTACSWTAVSSAPWLEIVSSTSGSGNRTAGFTVTRNAGATSRTATISIGPVTYTATQDAEAARIVPVTTEAQLQAAIAGLTSNTTIVVAPGIYRLTATLRINGALVGVTIKGSTGRAADVVLEGPGMTVDGGVPTALSVTGAVQGLQIADLTIQRFARYAILFEGGPQGPRLSNLHLVDSGDALIKTTVSATAPGVDDGILEGSSLEYTTLGATASAGGVDLRGSQRWIVRANAFRNVRAPGQQLARPAVSASAGSADTLVERNLFFNCQIGIAFGLTDRAGTFDHRGGRIVNNFIYRAPLVSGGPGISVADSPSTAILHNTVITSKTYAATIDYRYPEATNLVIANNLSDGPIRGQDNAWSAQTGNLTTATPGLFVYAAGGDLHLRPTATVALDLADPSTPVAADIDGQPRNLDRGSDIGADELSAATAPTVRVTQPATGAIFKPGTALHVQAYAASTVPIAFVDLYVNAVAIARLTTAPYVASVSLTQPGVYSLVAVVVDTAGGRAASTPVVIAIGKNDQP